MQTETASYAVEITAIFARCASM